MKKLKKTGITTLPLEIAKAHWPTIEKGKDGDKVPLDITRFTQSIDNFRQQSLNLDPTNLKEIKVQIDNNGLQYASTLNGEIYCGNTSPGGFAHECYHLIARKEANREISEKLKLHIQIKDECEKNNIKPSTGNYIKSNSQNNYKKLIAYLYLAEEEELISRLIGFYVGTLFGAAPKDMQEIVGLYDNMREFNITKKELLQDEDQIIREYIKRNPQLNMSINSPESIEKYVQKQGEEFLRKYRILFPAKG